MSNWEIGSVPIKMSDVRCYVRMTPEGQPQLIRVEPLYNDNGVLIPISVMMYVDNESGVMLDRGVAEMMTMAYTPLENITNGKGEPN